MYRYTFRTNIEIPSNRLLCFDLIVRWSTLGDASLHVYGADYRPPLLMEALARVATCHLNQWALDFDGNSDRILASIAEAKEKGCRLRLGPELEVTGYGCEDHFLEQDTFFHAWETIEDVLDASYGILLDVGMPVLHRNVRYNCRVFILDKRILLIRPKMFLANDGNYREPRWFSAWPCPGGSPQPLEDHTLPRSIRAKTGQATAPFGVALLELRDTVLATEACEELFTPHSPHILASLNGAEIILNGSGSHHNLGKLQRRMQLINSATAKCGGVYLYANQQGCDGGRLYYDGCAMVSVNGEVVAQGSQFSLTDMQVVATTVNLEEVRSYRGSIASRGVQAGAAMRLPRIQVPFSLCSPQAYLADPIPLFCHSIQEEIALGPACWLWDYLRRSGASGFFLPLSGGADSSATAALVGIMCQLVTQGSRSSPAILEQARRVTQDPSYIPTTPQDLCRRLFHTAYMGTTNSSAATRARAKALASEVGAYHLDLSIDTAIDGITTLFRLVTGKSPQFKAHGGSQVENLALQNIQARLRMVLSFLFAQLLPWVRGESGFLLVLGSANVDEALRGYLTKYDCSSADINPIGGISKHDLVQFLQWASEDHDVHTVQETLHGYPSLQTVVEAPPTAELEPVTETYTQTDEQDMGMAYADLTMYGRLRKIARCGPVSMYERLCHTWNTLSSVQVAAKVKRFFRYYGINRHKMTVLTPSYHAENYSPEDNRFDLRPFLYNTSWSRQFRTIDRLALEAMDADGVSQK